MRAGIDACEALAALFRVGHNDPVLFHVEDIVGTDFNALLTIIAPSLGDTGAHPCNYRRFTGKNQFQKGKKGQPIQGLFERIFLLTLPPWEPYVIYEKFRFLHILATGRNISGRINGLV
jgi:hypothetical protein